MSPDENGMKRGESRADPVERQIPRKNYLEQLTDQGRKEAREETHIHWPVLAGRTNTYARFFFTYVGICGRASP